ncbi:unnamed protein product [Schistosoma mansoni]|uniref:Smp_204820 n=1 Tax=Schistosoma mansoni TaxID=6183 RepID=G4LZT4_SCHMA|nr:unnamed protein product [Schistosoma mansoni]|eukprot:XP_018646752.1 unnamed protein product [Schistosoma mansoni]
MMHKIVRAVLIAYRPCYTPSPAVKSRTQIQPRQYESLFTNILGFYTNQSNQ